LREKMKVNLAIGLFFAISVLIIIGIYLIPIEDVVNRQLLFGLSFQFLGVLTTILIVRTLLSMRDNERWHAVNIHVYNLIFFMGWETLQRLFKIFKIKLEDMKESPTISQLGIEYHNPKSGTEFKQKLLQELKSIEEGGSVPIRKNMLDWDTEKFSEFSTVMKGFVNFINYTLNSFPHQIPPEFLSKIVDVREKARSLSYRAETYSNKKQWEDLGIDYQKHVISMLDWESSETHMFFSELRALLKTLDKNVSPESRGVVQTNLKSA